MSFEFIFKEDFVKVNVEVNSLKELIKKLAEPLFKENIVKNNFIEKVLERENKFPTGISMNKIGIAIPHTDPEFVNKNALSVGILKEPIEFLEMASPQNKIKVNIVFLLALQDSKKHLNILKNLMGFLQNKNALNYLINSNDQRMAFKVINNLVMEGL